MGVIPTGADFDNYGIETEIIADHMRHPQHHVIRADLDRRRYRQRSRFPCCKR